MLTSEAIRKAWRQMRQYGEVGNVPRDHLPASYYNERRAAERRRDAVNADAADGESEPRNEGKS